MNKSNVWPIFRFIIISIPFLIIGVFLGISINSNYSIEIDNKIRYSELLNWITTVIIGILVGYVLKNQYENNKVVKGYLLEDIKNISSEIVILKDYCYSRKNEHCFTEEQKREINAKINLVDKKITVFSDFLKDCYKDKYKEINESLVNSLNSFNRKVTGDGFYDNPIANSYFDEIMSESAKFESVLRRLTLKIIKEL